MMSNTNKTSHKGTTLGSAFAFPLVGNETAILSSFSPSVLDNNCKIYIFTLSTSLLNFFSLAYIFEVRKEAG